MGIDDQNKILENLWHILLRGHLICRGQIGHGFFYFILILTLKLWPSCHSDKSYNQVMFSSDAHEPWHI